MQKSTPLTIPAALVYGWAHGLTFTFCTVHRTEKVSSRTGQGGTVALPQQPNHQWIYAYPCNRMRYRCSRKRRYCLTYTLQCKKHYLDGLFAGTFLNLNVSIWKTNDNSNLCFGNRSLNFLLLKSYRFIF